MPHPRTKRRHIAPRRIGGVGGYLTDQQHTWLLYGMSTRGGAPCPFVDEDAARAAWDAHRDELMAGPMPPGWRPWGFWRFDCELKLRYGRIRWPIGIAGEAHLVWRDHAGPAERAAIEQQWLAHVRKVAGSCTNDHVAILETSYGVPTLFATRHLPVALLDVERERQTFLKTLTRARQQPNGVSSR